MGRVGKISHFLAYASRSRKR